MPSSGAALDFGTPMMMTDAGVMVPVDLATPPAPTLSHRRCGWIGGGDTVGEQSFITNAAQFEYVHPKWFTMNADGVTIDNAGNTDLATVVAAAKAAKVKLMPLIDADDATRLRLMIGSPTLMQQHVANLVAVAKAHGYVGLDIDYEHLWTAADRAPYTAFFHALATAMHAAGLELSMAITAMAADDGNNGYDYKALAADADVLHVMGYDYHYVGGDHLGPIAPRAWIDGTFQFAASTGYANKFILGVANYAIGSGWWTTALDAPTHCTGAIATTTTHMAVCPYGSWDPGRVLSCNTAQGALWWEDVQSMEEKLQAALKWGARGITYWTIGAELPGYFAMAKKYFP
jgi:spore germination protein YaaH